MRKVIHYIAVFIMVVLVSVTLPLWIGPIFAQETMLELGSDEVLRAIPIATTTMPAIARPVEVDTTRLDMLGLVEVEEARTENTEKYVGRSDGKIIERVYFSNIYERSGSWFLPVASADTLNPSCDTYLDSGVPNGTGGNSTQLHFGQNLYVPALMWTMPTIDRDVYTIDSISLHVYDGYTSGSSGYVRWYTTSSSFTCSSVTYNTLPSIQGEYIDEVANLTSTHGAEWHVFDLYGGDSIHPISIPDNGTAIGMRGWTTTSDGPSYGYYHSAENGTNVPYIEILYSTTTIPEATSTNATTTVELYATAYGWSFLIFVMGILFIPWMFGTPKMSVKI